MKTTESGLLIRSQQNERLDEENRVRLKEESRQAKLREKRKEEAKNDIILQVCLIKSRDGGFSCSHGIDKHQTLLQQPCVKTKYSSVGYPAVDI